MHICFIYLLIFGFVCYVHILGPGSDKLDPRSIKCVFLRHSHTQKGYQCYSPTLCRCFISVDVTLDESQSYFSPSVSSDSSPSCLPCLLPIPLVSPTTSPPQKPLQVYRHQQKPPTKTSSLPSDPRPDSDSLPIALRKGKCTCTSHPISQFMVICLHPSILLSHPWILLLFLSLSRRLYLSLVGSLL